MVRAIHWSDGIKPLLPFVAPPVGHDSRRRRALPVSARPSTNPDALAQLSADTVRYIQTRNPLEPVPTVAIIPAYNESRTVGAVIDGTAEHVDRVVVVDDCSDDDTVEVAREHGATVLKHAFNTGVGGAVRTGYRYAVEQDCDLVVQVDADGQHDPAAIPRLLARAEDCDMVIASRSHDGSIEEYPLVRRLGIRVLTRTVAALGDVEVTDVTSGFRVYRTSLLESLDHGADRHWAVEQTLAAARQGADIEEVSIDIPPREKGDSQFTLDTLVLYPFRMIDAIARPLVFR